MQISDRGGGIPKSELEKLFLYHYTTAPQPVSTGDVPALVSFNMSQTTLVGNGYQGWFEDIYGQQGWFEDIYG